MLHLRSKPSEFLYKTLYFSIMMIGKSINLPICVSLQLILSKSSAKINHFSDSVSAASQQTTAACSAHPLRLLCTLTAAHIYILKNLYCASVAFQPNKPIQKKKKNKGIAGFWFTIWTFHDKLCTRENPAVSHFVNRSAPHAVNATEEQILIH